ncbi:DNA mismatch endonuclease, patch repair protein [bacterium A37T11]|nr:DNA mismatch endonuclease, patch repair protein [bacterium A37T11]
MADVHSKTIRSYNMSRIRSRDLKPELLLRKALLAKNIRFRTHAKELPGKPDIVIRKDKLAIFVDGEFWHGYDWEKKSDLKDQPKFLDSQDRTQYRP